MSRQTHLSQVTNYLVPGIKLAATSVGIRYQGRKDLVLIEIPEGAKTAAVFTQNKFCAAPVVVAKIHLAATEPRYLLINSGNANAGTGAEGLRASYDTCRLLAAATGVAMNQILPFSTGVIGEDLPTQPFAEGIPSLIKDLKEDAWAMAAEAIMTTDTISKVASRKVDINGQEIVVTGMSKGSGMIHPNMATMLAYIGTNAKVSKAVLQDCLTLAVEPSFNSITVDGDTSTNDACVLIASATADVNIDSLETPDGKLFSQAVNEVCLELARLIVKDAEGATKLVAVEVTEASSYKDAKTVAYTVANSPLVKTALFASDPNWGRILAAVGRADIEVLEIDKIDIFLNDVCIVRNGGRDLDYTEQAGQAIVSLAEFSIKINLGQGSAKTSVLTSDLSYDYVKINAEYRS